MSKKKKIIISILVITIVIGGTALIRYGVKTISVTNLRVAAEKLIKEQEQNFIVQGAIESDETNINTKVPGNITKIKVAEGDRVKKGDVLMTIASEAFMAKKAQAEGAIAAATGQKKAAEASKAAAAAQLLKAQNGAQPEDIAKAKAAYEFAQSQDKVAKDSYDRIHSLFLEGIVSKQTDDETSVKMQGAATQMEVAKQTYDQAVAGARAEDKVAANALVNQADAMVQAAQGLIAKAQGAAQEAQSYIKDTTIIAPTNGVITMINPAVGELVSTGMPLIVISNIDKPWIEVKVEEKTLSSVALGQKVNVKLIAYESENFAGKVVRINQKPDFATKRATNDNGQYDILSYGVKVEFTKIDKELHPGMTALVDFGKKKVTTKAAK
ncbi:HlyD family secretion protein [Clostridium sp.]|jgi:HlyD family secretion protein|uniref:HlyD family secretion protein n=1 Tax=Clostridium sp. TaxID=1506 RepID=UPI003EEABCF8